MLNSNKMVEEFWESEASKNISYHIPIPKPYVDNLKTLLSLSRISVIEEVEEWANTYGGGVNVPRTLEDLLAKLKQLKND